MTKRRLAVTRRSAAFSSPRCTRRASLRSSAGSLISGSFWMSCKYWSNAPEGVVRKNAFALPPFDLAMRATPGGLPSFLEDGETVRRHLGRPTNRANIGFTARWCKSWQFSTSQIVRYVEILAFVHYPHRLWKVAWGENPGAGVERWKECGRCWKGCA